MMTISAFCTAPLNLVYEITGDVGPETLQAPAADGPEGYNHPDTRDCMGGFKETGLGLRFVNVGTSERIGNELGTRKDGAFERDLRLVDSKMPEILGVMVSEAYLNDVWDMKGLVCCLDRRDPLDIHPDMRYPFYSKKVKDLLVFLLCSSEDESEDLRRFLLENSYLVSLVDAENFSTYVWEEGERYYLTLAVQIRVRQKDGSVLPSFSA